MCLPTSVLLFLQLIALVVAATNEDIGNVFSLTKKDVPPGESCPGTIRHNQFNKTGPGDGYIRIPHEHVSADTSRCSAKGERPYTPLLDSSAFESEFKRNADLFPISNNSDLGLLERLRQSKAIIGILEFGDLNCGKHQFRKGTIVAVVRNRTVPLPELGLFNLIDNATYLLMFESNVPNPKRCVYRTAFAKSSGRQVPDCFPAQMTLEVSGKSVRMDQLKHGSRVASGSAGHSQVYAFSHRDHSSMGRYIRFSTDNTKHLIVSKGHYVFSGGILRPAHTIQVGDVLDTRTGYSRVVRVEPSVLLRGRFNPHTFSGEMLVNNFRVSAFTQELHPTVAHYLLAPVRLLWRATGGWSDRASPLRWLHGETKLRGLTRFLPSGPAKFGWQTY